MHKEKQLTNYLKDYHVITLKEARVVGIDPMTMTRAVRKGLIFRLSRGVYTIDKDIMFDPLKKYLPIAVQFPSAVIALISALSFHELTDEEERKIWIALPHSKKVQGQKNLKITRRSGLAYTLGIETHEIGKRVIKIYDPEKCIIDSFKYLTEEVAIKALKLYLKRKNVNIPKLLEYGKKLKRPISEKVKMITTE
ncbi:MAG: type IV toxin-antitoxin system AbiEi family antitoxin domain-containing protein [Pseudomonadota bacterium]